MQAHIYPTSKEAITALADHLVELCAHSLKEKPSCNIVLSGGNSPKKLHELLVSDRYKNKIDWPSLYFFFGDERYVPFEDENNNGHMAKQTLFDPLDIARDHIFYIDTSLPPDDCASDYWTRIRDHFGNQDVTFDIVILGLGDNAHTASLFPGTPVLEEKAEGVKAVFVPELGAYRITMTAPLINHAENILFLVFGRDKAEAVHQVVRGERNIQAFPAQLIETDGKGDWFLDEDAAARL